MTMGMIGSGSGTFKTTNQGGTSSSGGKGLIINGGDAKMSSSGGKGKMINEAGNRP